MRLPENFCLRMKKLLDKEYEDFAASYDQTRYYGLRVNTLKISVDDFLSIVPFSLEPVPWTKSGFYFNEYERPAKHPYYHAGLYYIQEPSAMLPAQVLGIEPGDRVLDLCAAPGGKSTQAAAFLKGEGVLVSNDVSAERTKALAKNLELFGVTNAVITNDTPERLAAKFPGYFNKILIDAPCSGEGMFRKDPDAVRQWGVHSTERCVVLQREILFYAVRMLASGGRMVYSTCTFAPEENEIMVEEFLKKNSEMELVEIPKRNGFAGGHPGWGGGNRELEKTIRLWPHKVHGEGHFAALLKKQETAVFDTINRNEKDISRAPAELSKFIEENLHYLIDGRFISYGDHVYLQPFQVPDLNGVKVVRPGLYLGVLKKNRFEPSHALALAMKKEAFKKSFDFSAGVKEIYSYLKGETLFSAADKGWAAILVDGHPLGWVKQSDGVLKNHYPKGWRVME